MFVECKKVDSREKFVRSFADGVIESDIYTGIGGVDFNLEHGLAIHFSESLENSPAPCYPLRIFVS